MMWDSPLYSVNMFYYHWLIKKLLWAVKSDIYRESRQNQGDDMHLPKETDAITLSGKPQPCGNTQNNINRHRII